MSTKTNYNVLIYYHFPKYVDQYQELLEKRRKDLSILSCKNRQEIEKNIEKADIIFSGSSFPVEFIPKAKNLKWIQSMSAGVENYTRSKLIPSDVILTKPKGIFSPLMAEYVIGYILAITQNMKLIFKNHKGKKWQPFIVDSIKRKTVGVMGLGSVGAHIAYRLNCLGVKVIGLDEKERNLPYMFHEYTIKETNEFLKSSDFVILALPLTDTTEGIIDEKQFTFMKPSAYIINISRGPLIQEAALLKALKDRQIAGAILDVFNEEPLPKAHPLWDLENVIITPHISGPSIPEDLVRIFLENLQKWEEGKQLVGVVDLSKGY